MRANGLQNVTILGMLIARSIVEQNKLRFDEEGIRIPFRQVVVHQGEESSDAR